MPRGRRDEADTVTLKSSDVEEDFLDVEAP